MRQALLDTVEALTRPPGDHQPAAPIPRSLTRYGDTGVEVFEFEVWLSTNAALTYGDTAADVRKILVAATDSCEAYHTALAMAWRRDWQVTKLWFVP